MSELMGHLELECVNIFNNLLIALYMFIVNCCFNKGAPGDKGIQGEEGDKVSAWISFYW